MQKLKFWCWVVATCVLVLFVMAGFGAPPGLAVSESGSSYLAVLGQYDVQTYGFRFGNYGNEEGFVNLTAADLQRLFGSKVCASTTGGRCTLSPRAQTWMEETNAAMAGGHCEGMATLSLLFFLKKLTPTQFGGTVPAELELQGNEKLQREIAYWYSTQFISPTDESEIDTLTPAEVVETLIASFQGTIDETYTIGLYKATAPAEGHAVMPWAVADKGQDIFAIKVYDNNYPGVDREILVDRKQNTWSYTTSNRPDQPESEYSGDTMTKNLTLAPTSIRLKPQICPFCETAA